jgi:hypothetical protein
MTPLAMLTENYRIDPIMNLFADLVNAKEERHARKRRTSASPSLPACGKCSSLQLPPNTTTVHGPEVSLTSSTSKSEAPKREHDTIAPPLPIRKTRSRVSPKGCGEGR